MTLDSTKETHACLRYRPRCGLVLSSALWLSAIATPSWAQLNASLSASGEVSGNGEVSGSVGTVQPNAGGTESESQLSVLDICRMPPEKEHASGYTKQRIVLFDLDGAAVTNGPELEVNEQGQPIAGREYHVFRDVRMHEHLRNVFWGKFPMRRHHTVPASITAPEDLWNKPTVSLEDMIRAAALDPFAAYSIACADWVVMPRVAKKDVKWRRMNSQRPVGNRLVPYQAWSLGATLTYEIAAFHFENGAWVNKGKVEASNTWMDLASTVNQAGEAANEIGRALKGGGHRRGPALSAIPDPTCKVPLVGDLQGVADGYGKCNAAATSVKDHAGRALSSSEGSPTPDAANGGAEANVAVDLPASSNPIATAEWTLKAKAEGRLPAGAVDTANAAEAMYTTCKAEVEGIVQVSKRLREMAANPVATVEQAAVGFAGCMGIPLSYDISGATAPGSEQSKSSFCSNVDDDVVHGLQSMRAVATCKGRIAGEHTALAVRVAAINQWWPVKLPLLNCTGPDKGDTRCIAVGKSEGIRRGDQFIATDHRGETLGFGRIVVQGKGGGERTPEDLSQFRLRAGNAAVGSPMLERAKIGMLLGVRPQAALLARHGELASSLLVGGAVEAAYNGGPYVPIGDEFWIRSYIAFMMGKEKEYFVNVEALPEAQYYLFSRVAAYVQSGVALNIGLKSVSTDTSNLNLFGLSVAAMLGAGFDVALSPDWSLRLGAAGAQGLMPMRLRDSAKTLTVDAGFLTWVQGGLSVNCNF